MFAKSRLWTQERDWVVWFINSLVRTTRSITPLAASHTILPLHLPPGGLQHRRRCIAEHDLESEIDGGISIRRWSKPAAASPKFPADTATVRVCVARNNGRGAIAGVALDCEAEQPTMRQGERRVENEVVADVVHTVAIEVKDWRPTVKDLVDVWSVQRISFRQIQFHPDK